MREALYILVVCDRREVVVDEVDVLVVLDREEEVQKVLMLRERRVAVRGAVVVALAAGEHRGPAEAVACAVLRNAKLLP